MALKFFAKVAEANTEITRLQAELTTAQTEASTAKTALETARTEHATALTAAQTRATEAEAKVTALTGERDGLAAQLTAKDGEITTLKASAKSVDQSGAEQAAAVAAGVGIPKPLAKADGENKTRAELMADFKAITDPAEKRAFWKKHTAALTGK